MTESRVLIAEEHVAFRQALAIVIDRRPGLRVVAQAGSFTEGLCKASEAFDVAVVDLSMSDGDGTNLVAALRHTNPRGCWR